MTRYAPLTLTLAAAAGISLLGLGLTLMPAYGTANETDAAPDVAAVVVPRLEPHPFEHYVPILEQPVFNVNHAPDPPPPPPASALPALGSYRLAGIIIFKDTRLALVERRDSKQIATLHVGDVFEGRRVGAITEGAVSFDSDGNTEVLATPKPAGVSWSVASHAH